MFASPYASRLARSTPHGALYQQVGVETGLTGATPHQLVAMLFEGYGQAVAQARGAIRSGDMLQKGQAIGRAVRIVEEGLRGGLNMSAGGTLAQDLNDLYTYLCSRLTLANLRNDESLLEECQRLIKPLHEAWTAIGPSAPVRR